ncbi:hypothetical protein X975_18887, partial [Stegodyphus mimosarum]
MYGHFTNNNYNLNFITFICIFTRMCQKKKTTPDEK